MGSHLGGLVHQPILVGIGMFTGGTIWILIHGHLAWWCMPSSHNLFLQGASRPTMLATLSVCVLFKEPLFEKETKGIFRSSFKSGLPGRIEATFSKEGQGQVVETPFASSAGAVSLWH